MKKFNTVVVGAGMFGASAAKHLSSHQDDVLVIGPSEPDEYMTADPMSFSSHYDEARITRRMGWDKLWTVTDSVSLSQYRDIEAMTGIHFFEDCGSLVLMAKSSSSRIDKMVTESKKRDILVEKLSIHEMSIKLPYLNIPNIADGVVGLYEEKMAGFINPRKLILAQLKLAMQNGARLKRDVVKSLYHNSSKDIWEISLSNESETIYSKKILLATGALTNFSNLLPPGKELKIHNFSEPNLLFEVDVNFLKKYKSMPAIVTVDPVDNGVENKSIYMLPPIKYQDGKYYIRIGPGMQPFVQELYSKEDVVKWFSEQKIKDDQYRFLMEICEELLPELQSKNIKSACCVISKTPTKYPYVGPVPGEKGLYVAVGGNGHGARGSEEIGRWAACSVMGESWKSSIYPDLLSPLLGKPLPIEGARPSFLRPPFGLC